MTLVYDIESMKRIVGDNPEVIHRLTLKFLNHGENGIQEIHVLCQQQDCEGIKMAAHRLKSASRSVGAMVLGDLFQELETACETANWAKIQHVDAALDKAFDELQMAIEAP